MNGMNASDASSVVAFLGALEKASRDTGVVLHAHGAQLTLEVHGRDVPMRLNRNFGDEDSYHRYVLESPA